MTLRISIVLTAALALAGCGGGGSGGGQPAPPDPTIPPANEPTQPRESETQSAAWLVQDNTSSLLWYANPNIDLPRHGRDGLQVERPQGGAAIPRLNFSPFLNSRLEPTWRFDNNARARLDAAGLWLWQLANQAYLQWTRHLNYDPGSLAVQVGDLGGLTCHGRGLACYDPNTDAVILSEDWIAQNYANLVRSVATDDAAAFLRVRDELFWVLTHEGRTPVRLYEPGRHH